MNTRAIGLDVGLKLMKWLTGDENLHYGLWTDIEVNAGNVGAAQTAYTDKLFKLLPNKPLRILDIGGGAGVTAAKLIALGHRVDIVVPSPELAEHCRKNAPEAKVHLMGFEDFAGTGPFDLCLFSESFQYMSMDMSLPKCIGLLDKGGQIIVSDCFRSDAFRHDQIDHKVGGGHKLADFDAALDTYALETLSREDITQAVAPSVDIEQELFNVVGFGLTRIDSEMAEAKPKTRWLVHKALGAVMNKRKRVRMDQRLNHKTRTSENFCLYNRYIMTVLAPK